MVHTFCTNIFIKNTNLCPGQRRARQLVVNKFIYSDFKLLTSNENFVNLS